VKKIIEIGPHLPKLS